MTTADHPSVSLQLLPGDGRIARRTDALLFVASGAKQSLTEAFTKATSSAAAADAVCAATINADPAVPPFVPSVPPFVPSVPPFVIVSWNDRTRLVIYGDLSLRTNQSSAPELSAAASTTWAEHTLLSTAETVSIGVGTGDADPATNLELGVAIAGGFVLSLTPVVSNLGAASHPADEADFPTMRAERADGDQPGQASNVTDLFSASASMAVPSVVFDDGTVVVVDRGLLVGRKPDPARDEALAETEPLVISDPKLSRNHLVLDRDGETVTVTDCGSLNGTVLISEPGAVPLHLRPSMTVTLGAESLLYLGDQVIRLAR